MAHTSSLGVPGLNLRGIFFGILVIALIAALFFIPEIIDFQRSLSGKTPNAPTGSARASNSVFSGTSESPLSKLRGLLDGGISDRLRMRKVVERGDQVTGYSPTGGAAMPISWQDLSSKQTKKQFQQADQEIDDIVKALPIDRTLSRYALVTLSGGLREVGSGSAEKTLSPEEAIRYLEYLHANVSRSLLQDNVDRLVFERWQRVSFGALLANFSRQLDRQFIPFNPQLTLTDVEITQRSRKNRFEEQTPAYVSAKGYVVGADIERIEVYGAGIEQRTIKVKKPDAQGIARFSLNRMEARGLITLRVVSKNGQKFEKIYQFSPRYRIFPYRKGKYLIPAATSQSDTSVDRFFTRGVRGAGGYSNDFFGGPLVTSF